MSVIGLLVEASFGYSCAFSRGLGFRRRGLDNPTCKNKVKRDSAGRNGRAGTLFAQMVAEGQSRTRQSRSLGGRAPRSFHVEQLSS